MAKQFQKASQSNPKAVQAKLEEQPQSHNDSDNQSDKNSKQDKSRTIKKKQKNKGKKLYDSSDDKDKEDNDDEEKEMEEIYQNQKVQEGEAFMLPQERQIEKNNPKYHFCRFISRHYRLIEDKKDRKNHFIRMQPVFVRFLHVLKLHNLPLITIDTFRKYFKKFCKRRGIKYDETTNRVDMRVVVGIDRRYNSKFEF